MTEPSHQPYQHLGTATHPSIIMNIFLATHVYILRRNTLRTIALFFPSTGDSEWTLKKVRRGQGTAGNQKRRRGICAFLKALQDSISKQNLIFGSSGIPFIIAGSGEPESQSTFDISFSRSEGGQLKDHGGRSRTGWAFIELLDLDVLVNRTTSSSSPQYVAFLVNYVMIVNIGSPSFLILALPSLHT